MTARTVPAHCNTGHDRVAYPRDRRAISVCRVRWGHWFGLGACGASLVAYAFTSHAVPVFWEELTRLLQKV